MKPQEMSVVLMNATRRDRALYVLGPDEELLELPRAIPPELLQSPNSDGAVILPVRTNTNGPAAHLRLYAGYAALGVMNDLPRQPGVIYLVDPEDLAKFPDRGDFYAPAGYRWVGSREDGAPLTRTVLVAVTRSPWAVATPDTPVITEDDWEEPSGE